MGPHLDEKLEKKMFDKKNKVKFLRRDKLVDGGGRKL